MAVTGVPKLKLAGCAAVPGVLKEKRPAGWLLAGVWAALPKLKPPEAAGVEKEKPVVAVVVAVFGVPKAKPPPAAPDPKLNWFMAAAACGKRDRQRTQARKGTAAAQSHSPPTRPRPGEPRRATHSPGRRQPPRARAQG